MNKKNILSKQFKDYFKELLQKEAKEFFEWSLKPLNSCIRINTLKINEKEIIERLEKKGWVFNKISFVPNGYKVIEKPNPIGKSLEHLLGYFYVQESASMIPPIVLNPEKHSIVLDIAAAPGSKTTSIAQIMKNTGIIVANEPEMNRLRVLRSNIQRMGVINTIITRMDGRSFRKIPQKFNYVLLDAPCSASGTVRRNLHIPKMWSLKAVEKLSKLQKQLILSSFDSLEQNGTLVYSTCSVTVEENEEVIDFLLEKRGTAKIEKINLKLKKHEPILEWKENEFHKSIKNALRILPQDNDSEGFFVCKIKRVE